MRVEQLRQVFDLDHALSFIHSGDIQGLIEWQAGLCSCQDPGRPSSPPCSLVQAAPPDQPVSQPDTAGSPPSSARALQQPSYGHVRPLGADLVVKDRWLDWPPAAATPIPLSAPAAGPREPARQAQPCDVFTTETIIGCVMAELHDGDGLPTVVPLRAAWPCHRAPHRTMGQLAFDRFERGELARLPATTEPDAGLLLLAQVLLTMDLLKREYDFVSGDCKASNVLLRSWGAEEDRALRFELSGQRGHGSALVLRASPMVAAMADFDAGSITYPAASRGTGPRTRYFGYRTVPLGLVPRSLRPELRLYRRQARPWVYEQVVDHHTGLPVECYRIGTPRSHRSAYLALRHGPSTPPLSYDLYTLLVSLALEDSLAPWLGPGGALRPLWEGLWLAQERERADDAVQEARRRLASSPEAKRKIKAPMRILGGLTLKRGAMAGALAALIDLLLERDLATLEGAPPTAGVAP